MTDRKRPAAGFWITVALVAVLAGYPLSLGPECWINERTDCGSQAILTTYRPIFYLGYDRPDRKSLSDAIIWYAKIGASGNAHPAISLYDDNEWRKLIWIYRN